MKRAHTMAYLKKRDRSAKVLSVRVTEETWAAVQAIVKREGVSVSDALNAALARLIHEQKGRRA